MRVLLTNWRLKARAGSELYLFDVARWLRDNGHVPVAYAPLLGPLADEIRREAIAVIDDLRLMAEPPDVIHGQHHLSTMSAIARFPGVPVVAFCHGWAPWEEMPVRHPQIRRYVAISAHTRERMVLESGIDPALVSVLPNFVDTQRFRPRANLPDRPRRALIFSNYAAPGMGWVVAVGAACEAQAIALETVGMSNETAVDRPEDVLPQFDLVFAKARASIEAMATGAAVILCDAAGLGPMVTPANFDELGQGNFGMRVLRSEHDVALIEAAIAEYNPERALAVMELVRKERAKDIVLPRLARLYEEAIAESLQAPVSDSDADQAMADYLYQLNKLDPVPAEPIRRHYDAQLASVARALDRARGDEQPVGLLRSNASALESDRDLLGRNLDVAQNRVGELQAELELMRSSTSWRFTGPLRRVGDAVRRLARIGRS